MPPRISDEERQRIVDLLPSGRSARSIAKETGRSANTVSRIAKAEGHVWGRVNLARAQDARLAYGAEWRADFAKRLAAKCDGLLDSMEGSYLVYNFGGRDNVYTEHTLDAPPTDAKAQLVKSIRLAIQTVLDIDRHDRTDDDMAVVDEWLKALRGEA
jgi:hypothetical protein